MRDPKRIDVILQEISNIWHKYPDMRLGQLIGNVLEGVALYYVEDDGLVSALKNSYDHKQEVVQFAEDEYIFNLIKKHPDELGFVLQEDTYKDYQQTFIDAGSKAEDAELTELDFNNLKNYFKALK